MLGAKQKMKERCNGYTAQTNCVSVRTQQITLENLGNPGFSDTYEPCEKVCHFHCHWPIDGQGACWVNGFCFLDLSSMTHIYHGQATFNSSMSLDKIMLNQVQMA